MEKVTEIIIEEVVRKAVQYFLEEFLEYSTLLVQIQDSYGLRTSAISSHGFLQLEQISYDERNKIHEYRHNFKRLIASVAFYIERKSFQQNGINENSIKLTGYEKKRAIEIVKKRRDLSLSFKTLKAILDIFFKINQKIRNNTLDSENSSEEYDNRLKNAVLSYELIDFTYNYINQYELFGKDKLMAIKKNILDEIDKEKANDAALRNKMKSEEYKDFSKKKIEDFEKNINDREEIREYFIDSWNDFEKKILGTEEQIGIIKKMLLELDLLRDNARNHIASLSLYPLISVMQEEFEIANELEKIEWNLIDDFTLNDIHRMSKTKKNKKKAENKT